MFKPNILLGQSSKLLFIAPGTSFPVLQEKLYKEGYVYDIISFKWLAYLMNYNKRILPGAYKLYPSMSNWQAIRKLRAGIQEPVKLVLHSHSIDSKEELANKISEHSSITPEDFLDLLADSSFVQSYGFTTENVLTMFIPNTYYIYWSISARHLFEKLYKEYQKFWNQERLSKAQQINLTPIQVSILASIVEKETNKAEEAPMIAGVYINRLNKRMKLQADPTLIYILQDPLVKRVLAAHRHIDSPYNTYLYGGLPPGPITLPSITAIDAVLNYQPHAYLYFVSKEDLSGYHYFAKTFTEHKQNAKKYRSMLNKSTKHKK